ncbi:hypothetical protein [Caballeronia sp. LZ043]|uniref:hypothetical protein n=1 Tax=Caballeronia sp. LZ043 TaxID=3038569 RepID=UPI00285B2938|nr:hypothetical protein [Caballeronia sp. LZ043]MDR5823641.1 hypothetical protein [Caballeronia sp. LZ043]
MTQTPPDHAPIPARAWFQRFAGHLEQDDDFRAHGRWLTARIAYRCDQQTVVMQIDRGIVLDVVEGYSESDYLISGTREQWNVLFEAGWGLVRLYRTGTLTVRADPVRLMQNWKALFFITEAMRHFSGHA